jgi:membrane protein YqaA with SNARE-associated domain
MEEPKQEKFGIKHLLMLLASIAISVLIIIFSKELRNLEQFGYIGIFLLMFLGNATVLVPVPVLAPLNILLGGIFSSPLLLGLTVGVASSLGELVGYLAGYSGSGIVKSSKVYKKIELQVEKYGLWAILFLALIPNPLFDVAGLAAGALGIKWWKFLIAVTIGKTIRAIVFAYIGYTGSLLISKQ